MSISRNEARMIAEELHGLISGSINRAVERQVEFMNDEYISAEEVAEMLSCSVRSVYNHLDDLPHTTIPGGRKLVFSKNAVKRRLINGRN